MKKDYLLPRHADPGADYIRARLRRRVELERGITMTGKSLTKLLQCLEKSASLDRIGALHDQAIHETSQATWGLEMEALLRELHGDWRYDGREETLRRDMSAAARFYGVALAMDMLLQECGFHTVRTHGERMDDAACFPISKERSI